MPCTKDTIPQILVAIRGFIKRVRCILACCDSQINIIQSELDGDKEKETRSKETNPENSRRSLLFSKSTCCFRRCRETRTGSYEIRNQESHST